MARIVVLLLAVAATIGVALWGFGVFEPSSGGIDLGAGEGEAPGLVGGPGSEGAPEAAGPAAVALAVGAPRPVVRSAPPTVDGPKITGRVTDRAGRPVPGAYVVAMADSATKLLTLADLGQPDVPAFDTLTDAEGRFAVAVTKGAARHALVAQAAGFGPTILLSVATSADVTLVLDAGGILAGTVTDAAGNGLVGAKVQLHGVMDVLRLEFEAVAGPGGAYRIEGLPALSGVRRTWWTGWSCIVEVRATDFAPVLVAGPTDLAPGKELRRDFILVRGPTVEGRVVDAETGAPLPGARVVIWSTEAQNLGQIPRASGIHVPMPWAQRTLGEAKADADGRYRFEHLPCAAYHPSLSSNWGRRGSTMGYLAAWTDDHTPASEDLPFVPDGTRLEIDLKLWPAAIVAGRVVDAQGAPAAGVHVYAATGSRGAAWIPDGLVADAPMRPPTQGTGTDGAYELRVAAATAGPSDAKLTARREDGPGPFRGEPAGTAEATVSVTAGERVVAPDLVLAAPPSSGYVVELLVTTEDGRPFPGAQATVNWIGLSVRTDAEGKATLRVPDWFAKQLASNGPMAQSLGAGAQLHVGAAGFARSRVELPKEATTAPLSVVLKRGRTLAGRVLLADGTPLSKGRVVVADGRVPVEELWPTTAPARGAARPRNRGGEASYSGAPLDAEGRFVVEDLPEGPYHVGAWSTVALSSGPQVASYGLLSGVAEGAEDLEIRMPPGSVPVTGSAEGRVVDATTNRPVPGVSAFLQRPGEAGPAGLPIGYPSPSGARAPRFTVNSPGLLEAVDVPVGAWTLLVMAEGYRPFTLENLVVRSGETTTFGPLGLERGVRVRGRLRFPEAASSADRQAVFQSLDATGPTRTLTTRLERDGTFSQTGFTPGTYRVSASMQGWSGTQEPALVAPLDASLTIREGELDVTYDASLVVAGSLAVQVSDDRLPPAPWRDPTPPTEAQLAFGKAARLVLLDGAGKVLAEHTGLTRLMPPGALGHQLLPAGTYTVRYEAPGEEPKQGGVEVKAGQTVMIMADKTGVTGTPMGGEQKMRSAPMPAGPAFR